MATTYSVACKNVNQFSILKQTSEILPWLLLALPKVWVIANPTYRQPTQTVVILARYELD